MGNTACGDDDVILLSEDVLIQILVWLPVISLLRFKSVCKSWRALIETPFFIDLHTTTTFNSNSSSSKFGSLILQASQTMLMLSSSSGSGGGGGGDEDIIYNMDSLWSMPCYIDSRFFGLYIHIIGSCNGLICAYHKGGHDAIYLWNPATRQFRILPKPIIITIEEEEEEEEEGVLVTMFPDFVIFGFDVKTKDYKVVMFKPFRTPAHKHFSRIQVYNLSTDSWRLLEGLHYLPALPFDASYQNQGIYMNGSYFFVGKDVNGGWLWGEDRTLVCNNSLMYSFDFTKEILTSMQFPDHDSRHDMILSCLGADKIALFMIQRNISIIGSVSQFRQFPQFRDCGGDNEYYDIWVLNEQPGSNWVGVVNKESWTKVHSFRKINKLKRPTQPRCISNNGEFALISITTPRSVSELQLFNLVTKEPVKKDFPFDCGIERSFVYTQSLVSI